MENKKDEIKNTSVITETIESLNQELKKLENDKKIELEIIQKRYIEEIKNRYDGRIQEIKNKLAVFDF
jgi:hypothetical protein